jgi:hypothetical protein
MEEGQNVQETLGGSNLFVDTVADTEKVPRDSTARVCGKAEFACSFIRHTGLSLRPLLTVVRELH